MGMLDGLLGQVLSTVGGAAGQQGGLAGSVLGMLNQQGGLQGLVQQMEQQGLGNVVQSWIGTGQNLPISPEQIQAVLGNQQLQQLAQQHGIDVNELASHLSQILPAAVDHMTPNGQVPAPAQAGLGALGGLVQGFLGGNKPQG